MLRIALVDNLAAIARRGSDADAPRRTAAAACLRVADALRHRYRRPATAAHIVAANAVLHADAPSPTTGHTWKVRQFHRHLLRRPRAHQRRRRTVVDLAGVRDTTTLVRLTRTSAGTQIAALVRYRTTTGRRRPVSRLGPLYGVQQAMWRQFRVGYVRPWPDPVAPLADHDPAIAFARPADDRVRRRPTRKSDRPPAAGRAITVLCQTSLLLRQLALRATLHRPLIVVADDAQRWSPIVASAHRKTRRGGARRRPRGRDFGHRRPMPAGGARGDGADQRRQPRRRRRARRRRRPVHVHPQDPLRPVSAGAAVPPT
ncbi:hypothetical protein I553_3807, partial [Mycobacterium xenopi 4042]